MIENFRECILGEIPGLLKSYQEIKPLSFDQISNVLEKESQINVPVIFPSGWINGLGIIRGIGRHGIKSVVMDPAPNALSFYSKYAFPYQCNEIVDLNEDKEKALFDELLALSKGLKAIGKNPVLFLIASEKLLPFINKYHDELSQQFTFTANFKDQLILEDKKVQMDLARKAGIDIPASNYINDREEFENIIDKLIFPQIIKPRKGKSFYRKFGVQAYRVANKEEARSIFEKVNEFQLIFQEEVQGPDQNLYTYGSYYNKNGEPLAEFTGKKLKSNRDFGTCSVGVSIEAPEITNRGRNFMKTVCYHGASQIEFKLDERDNKFKFIEINNRFWKWHSLAIECDVNIPYIQFLDSVGLLRNESNPKQVNGKKWWMTLADLYAESRDLHGDAAINQLASYGSDFVDGIGSWDDPLPALVNFLQFKWI